MPVIAVREGTLGRYVGFEVDTEILECCECTQDAAYRVLFTQDERAGLEEHRFATHQVIESEHPHHSDKIIIH